MGGLSDDVVIFAAAMAILALFCLGVLRDEAEKGSRRRRLLEAAMLVPLLGVGGVFLWAGMAANESGRYQPLSLRADLDRCLGDARNQVRPVKATNTCDRPIVVGLCMPGEVNPTPCAQAITLGPGESTDLDPGDARLSSAPGNPDGLTVVACAVGDRPSRDLNSTLKAHTGVCLPPAS